jgi:hypothetical protein
MLARKFEGSLTIEFGLDITILSASVSAFIVCDWFRAEEFGRWVDLAIFLTESAASDMYISKSLFLFGSFSSKN